jgi:acylphosphatase
MFVEGAALDLGVKGYVCNRSDGSVEVFAEGAHAVLEQLRAELEKGPVASRVTRVAESPAPLRNYHTFSIEATR